MRRVISLFVLFAVLFSSTAAAVSAQATPEVAAENPFADLGLPQIDITVTDTAFEGVPSELDAGRYAVALTNETEGDFGSGGAFMQIPEGMTTDEFLDVVSPPEAATPVGESDAAAEASPVAEDAGGDAPPPWYYETVIAGGPYAATGETSHAVVELTAGEWVFWAEYPGAPQAPVAISVSGDLPADLPEPAADVTIEMSDFAFDFSPPLTAGSHVIEVANVGDQPHFVGIAGVPDGTTEEDVLALIEAEFGGDPAATPMATPVAGLSFEDIEDVFGTGDHSAGVTAWYSATLEPGTHVAVCFVTDPETGLPHVMLGMLEVFEVE